MYYGSKFLYTRESHRCPPCKHFQTTQSLIGSAISRTFLILSSPFNFNSFLCRAVIECAILEKPSITFVLTGQSHDWPYFCHISQSRQLLGGSVLPELTAVPPSEMICLRYWFCSWWKKHYSAFHKADFPSKIAELSLDAPHALPPLGVFENVI